MNKNNAHIVSERCTINEIFNFSQLFCSLNAKLWFLILIVLKGKKILSAIKPSVLCCCYY